MQPQDLLEHRQGIVSEVRVVVFAGYVPTESPEIVTAYLAWWADELQDWTREQVVWGLRKFKRDTPGKRPEPGHILAILKQQRGAMEVERSKVNPASADEPRKPMTPEQIERMAEAGNRAIAAMRERAQ